MTAEVDISTTSEEQWLTSLTSCRGSAIMRRMCLLCLISATQVYTFSLISLHLCTRCKSLECILGSRYYRWKKWQPYRWLTDLCFVTFCMLDIYVLCKGNPCDSVLYRYFYYILLCIWFIRSLIIYTQL